MGEGANTKREPGWSVEAGYESRVIDFARRVLYDVPECAGADYAVRWVVDHNLGGKAVPLLVIAFHLLETVHQPALGIALVTVRKGTLLDVMPGRTLYEGDKLRSHILRSVDDYLQKHGVRLSLPFGVGV